MKTLDLEGVVIQAHKRSDGTTVVRIYQTGGLVEVHQYSHLKAPDVLKSGEQTDSLIGY